MKKNAIILAAGKSIRFAPFTYEKPKGLFRVRGEILIERQIEQLIEAGVQDIYIVVGYMKEKFFYLENKYGVRLVVNNQFSNKGNIYSLFKAIDYLSNTFICCADHYYVNNPFIDNNDSNVSYRACVYQSGKFREFAVSVSDANVITDVRVGGEDSYAMVGYAYVNDSFGSIFRSLVKKEIDDFGIASMFWEEYYAKHIMDLSFYAKKFEVGEILEFENIEELKGFDSEFLVNVDSDIIQNITRTLSCDPTDINKIEIINAGLTNVSFSFWVNGKEYVYRHPGGTAGYLIDRKAELYAQMAAKEIKIDESVIKMDLSGWKISHYVIGARNCCFEESDAQLEVAMNYLRRLHEIKICEDIKVFDNMEEGKKLLKIASATKGNLEKEFGDIIEKIERLYEKVKADANKLGINKVLCHNDVYEPNYLIDMKGEIYLIDWEYAGINYDANDIGGILCRYDWDEDQIDRYLRYYIGRELTWEEKRYYYAFIPISGFYWFCWGLYKGSVGDDDSFFFLPAYRNIIRFLDKAIESYKEGVEE